MPDAAGGHGPGRPTTEGPSGRPDAPGGSRGRGAAAGDRAARGTAERPRAGGQQQRAASERLRPADRVRGWRHSASSASRRLTGAGSRQGTLGGHDSYDRAEPAAPGRPRGRPYRRSLELDVDWRRVRLLAAGLTAGALLGAGVALLTAPQSGSRTRRQLANAGRRAGTRAVDAWEGLGDELRVARARARRDVKRGLRSGRREAVDAWTDLDRRALQGLRSIRQWRAERDRSRGRERGRAGPD